MDVYRLPSGDVRILTARAAEAVKAQPATDEEAGVFFRSTLKRPEPEPQTLTPQRAATGIAGIASEAMGRGLATRATAEDRWSTCLGCDRFDLGKCSAKGCGCHLSAKIRLARESCPEGRWVAEAPTTP